jgi:hypothetical protein
MENDKYYYTLKSAVEEFVSEFIMRRSLSSTRLKMEQAIYGEGVTIDDVYKLYAEIDRL